MHLCLIELLVDERSPAEIRGFHLVTTLHSCLHLLWERGWRGSRWGTSSAARYPLRPTPVWVQRYIIHFLERWNQTVCQGERERNAVVISRVSSCSSLDPHDITKFLIFSTNHVILQTGHVPVTAAGSPPEETSSHLTLGFRCFWLKLIFGEFSWRVIPFWFGLYVPSAISRPLLLESHGFMLSFTVWLFSSGLCSFIVIFTRLWGCFRPWFQDTENVGYSIWIAAALVVLTGCSTVWGPTPESFCSLRSRIVRFDLTPRGLSVEALIFFPPFTCFKKLFLSVSLLHSSSC